MKKYNIKVNGVSYEVEVDEVLGEFDSRSSSPIEVANETPKKSKPLPKVQEKKTVTTGEKIECPMPGTVLKVNVNPGDNVKTGQVMFILEAMKMENEIMAPHDAKILQVIATAGASVNTGDILAVIE